MRLEDNLTKLPSYPDKEAIHEAWLDIPGAHWLHPAHSYADDCHLDYTDYTHPTIQNFTTGYTLIHYRDDFLAYAAVQEEGGMIDNIAALPLKSTPSLPPTKITTAPLCPLPKKLWKTLSPSPHKLL